MDGNKKTLAIQISTDLSDRIQNYLRRKNVKLKTFLTELIEHTLDEDDSSANGKGHGDTE